jgi:uncharacterized protein
MFFQSGGCCEGSVPMCFGEGEFQVGSGDIELGTVGGCPFYIWGMQFESFKDTQLILDVAPGAPEGFSLPAGEDSHFVVRLRLFDEDERAALASA